MNCLYKTITGFDCIGCGITRAVIYLLQGDLYASIKLYPALIPFLISLLLVIFIHYKPIKILTNIKNLFIGMSISILLINYLITL